MKGFGGRGWNEGIWGGQMIWGEGMTKMRWMDDLVWKKDFLNGCKLMT